MIPLKRLIVLALAAAVVAAAFFGCKKQDSTQSGGPGTQSGASAPLSSGTASGAPSGTAAPSGGAASGGAASAAGQSVPAKVVVKPSVSVQETAYKFVKDKKSLRAEYPQISSSGKDYGKVNELLKSTALKTIQSVGTANTAAFAEVKVTDHVAYKDENFLSVTFQESYKSAEDAEAKRSFRAVNYDLKAGRALSAADMVQNNGALLKALQNAVQSQMSEKKAASYPASVVQAGAASAVLYFKDNGTMGFSLPVSHELGDHVELSVKYKDTAGFRTENSAWQNFVKK